MRKEKPTRPATPTRIRRRFHGELIESSTYLRVGSGLHSSSRICNGSIKVADFHPVYLDSIACP
jgi:hypothetical protein